MAASAPRTRRYPIFDPDLHRRACDWLSASPTSPGHCGGRFSLPCSAQPWDNLASDAHTPLRRRSEKARASSRPTYSSASRSHRARCRSKYASGSRITSFAACSISGSTLGIRRRDTLPVAIRTSDCAQLGPRSGPYRPGRTVTFPSEAADGPVSKLPHLSRRPVTPEVSVDSNRSLPVLPAVPRRSCFSALSDTVRCMGEGGLSHWLRWWGGALAAAVCAGAAFIAQVQTGEHLSTWASWSIKVGGTIATVIALLLPARQTWVEVRAREDAQQLAKIAVTNYQLALRSILLPLTDIFDRIITAPSQIGQVEAKGAAKQAVVNSVVQFTGVPRARSCYFDYEQYSQEKKLVCRIYSGRDAKPRTEFSSVDPRHTEVFKLLEDRRSEMKENLTLEDSERFPDDRDYNYETYISVPVATSAEIYGLLTLDALHAGELLPQHEKEVLLLAQLLGIALAGGS